MSSRQSHAEALEAAALPWMPLVVAALCSYGPVGFNYGFALYFLNYRHGFVKRGLVGELVAWMGMLPRWKLIGIEYIFLALGFAMTYALFRRLLFGEPGERRLAVLLLSAPAALPHLGYLFAQPDITLYLLMLGCLALFVHVRADVAAALSLPLCWLGLLGHEGFSLMFYPLVVAVMLYLCARGRMRCWMPVLHVVLMGAAFAAVVHWGSLKVPAETVLAEAQARTDTGVQRQVYDVMASTLPEQKALVMKMYTPGVMRILWLTLILSAPLFMLLVKLLEGSLRAARVRWWVGAAMAVLFCSPLLLCTLGHDTTRWIGAMCLDATLFVLYLCVAEPEESAVRAWLLEWARGPALVAWIVYLVAIGPYGATGLRSAEQIVGAWMGM